MRKERYNFRSMIDPEAEVEEPPPPLPHLPMYCPPRALKLGPLC